MTKIYVAFEVEGEAKISFMSKDLDKLKAHVVDFVNKNRDLDEDGPIDNFDTDYTGFEIGETTSID